MIKILFMISFVGITFTSSVPIRVLNENDNETRVELVSITTRDISDLPIDTFGYGSLGFQLSDVRIRLNNECISSNRRSEIYLSRKCDIWEMKPIRDSYFVVRNVEGDQYLTSNTNGDAYLTTYTGLDTQLWFLATNLKSTRLFNKVTKEYLDRDQGGKIVTSPYYGIFERTKKVILINDPKVVLNIDTY